MKHKLFTTIVATGLVFSSIAHVAFAAETGESFLNKLKQEFELSKLEYRQNRGHVEDTENRLHALQEERVSLSEQLENLDQLIKLTQEKLVSVSSDVVETENDIFLIYEEIEAKEIALGEQKSMLKDYLRLLYEESNSYLTVDENGEIDAFKMLLTDESVGDSLRELKYLDLLSEAGTQLVERLAKLTDELERNRRTLDHKRQRLTELEAQVAEEKKQLEYQKRAKQNLLDLTLGQEQIYIQLLEQTVDEQKQLLNDVKNLNNALQFIEKEIAEKGEDINVDDYLGLLDLRTKALYEFKRDYSGRGNDFAWPIEPDRGISAYFKDQAYVGVFGVQHYAIDIPAYQGTPTRAAADGVVYTVKDNGYGYSYIILAHADGIMTVYGHMTEMLVTAGETISKGEIIGLSGGMPGTKGAGYMTTGPHLHFEVLKGGKHQDPMYYLPLNVFDEEDINKMPSKYYDNWLESIYGVAVEAVSR